MLIIKEVFNRTYIINKNNNNDKTYLDNKYKHYYIYYYYNNFPSYLFIDINIILCYLNFYNNL